MLDFKALNITISMTNGHNYKIKCDQNMLYLKFLAEMVLLNQAARILYWRYDRISSGIVHCFVVRSSSRKALHCMGSFFLNTEVVQFLGFFSKINILY
jgi:hypothetical protein